MIYCICGIIGVGKTTYVKQHKKPNDEVIDWDDIKELKHYQDDKELNYHILGRLRAAAQRNLNTDTWFTCTIPNKEEQEILNNADVQYIWLHASIERSLQNIEARNRGSEAQHLDRLRVINTEIQSRADLFIEQVKAEIVAPYATIERW